MAKDMLNRVLKKGDYVVFTNNLYEVVEDPPERDRVAIKIMLLNPSKTTRPVYKSCTEMCRIPAEDVMVWMLTKS